MDWEMGGFEIVERFNKLLLGKRSEKKSDLSFNWLVEIDWLLKKKDVLIVAYLFIFVIK